MNILLVEDDPIQVRLYERLIKQDGEAHPVANTPRADMALDWCAEHQVDLVIVDFHLGGKENGLDFIRRFRRLYDAETVPLLMVTANLERDVRLEALALGATDFLTKPMDVVEFSARIKNMLALRSYAQQIASRAALLGAEVRRATKAIENREHEVIIRLARTAEYIDPATGAHIQRISHYARCIANALKLTHEEGEMLFDAAPMHDIGKVAVPSAILVKPGPLNADEVQIMHSHPLVGYDILKDSESKLVQTAASVALTHHERWDGSGYPRGLVAENIPLFGRIVAVADVFDALASQRPYKPAWSVDRAIAEIKRDSGSQFDPRVVGAFLAAVPNLIDIKSLYASSA